MLHFRTHPKKQYGQKRHPKDRHIISRCLKENCSRAWLTGFFPYASEKGLERLEARWQKCLERWGIHWSPTRHWYTDGLGRLVDDFRHLFLRWKFIDMLFGTDWIAGIDFFKEKERYYLRIAYSPAQKTLIKDIIRLAEGPPFLGSSLREPNGNIIFPSLAPTAALTICAFIHGQRRAMSSDGRTNTSRVAERAPLRQRPSNLSISTPFPDEACTNSPLPI